MAVFGIVLSWAHLGTRRAEPSSPPETIDVIVAQYAKPPGVVIPDSVDETVRREAKHALDASLVAGLPWVMPISALAMPRALTGWMFISGNAAVAPERVPSS